MTGAVCAQTSPRGIIYGKDTFITVEYKGRLAPINKENRRKALSYGIPAAILGGSGLITMFFSAVFITGATERDPAKFSEIQKKRNKGLLIGGSMVAASVPLFVISGSYMSRYRAQKRNRGAITFKAGLEPLTGYNGKEQRLASLGLQIGL